MSTAWQVPQLTSDRVLQQLLTVGACVVRVLVEECHGLASPDFLGPRHVLQPQHIQQQDSYHEARLRCSLHWLSPFCWGVKTFVLNETALRNFTFEIEQGELVTWEGTLVRFQGERLPSNARILPRSFEQVLDPGGGPVGVYLGIKRLQWEEANTSLRPELDRHDGTADGQSRFSSQERDTPDFFMANGQSACLQYLLHEVRLLFDQDAAVQSQEYELVKLAEVLRAAQSQGAVLSRRYVPPSMPPRVGEHAPRDA